MKKILNKIRRRLFKRVTPLEYLKYVFLCHVDREPAKIVRQEQNLRFFYAGSITLTRRRLKDTNNGLFVRDYDVPEDV